MNLISITHKSTMCSQTTPATLKRWKPSYRQVWTFLSFVPCLGKLHRLEPREERGTEDRVPRHYQARQQAAVRPMEDSNT